MNFTFEKKSFTYKLSSAVDNANQTYEYKSGWIIKLQNIDKGVVFGEVSPLRKKDFQKCN